MTARPDVGHLRRELRDLLQENDDERQLDSLETVVVLTYLNERALAPPTAGTRPHTIEGWLTWVGRHSPDS
ncbi:MAG TPA: hypothetical protein VH352_17055 [Pseudonocardiaceae bacterium]|nr:hypothetical protein [Pseudonocardiaceae bacterium]